MFLPPNVTAIVTLIVCTVATSLADACPLVLKGQDLTSIRGFGARSEWQAYRVVAEKGKRTWKQVPMQVDPLDKDGYLEFFDDKVAWWDETLAEHDRIVVAPDAFGLQATKTDGRPCSAMRMLEVKNTLADNSYTYLLPCARPVGFRAGIPKAPSSVQHDTKNHVMLSKRFEYHYQPNNQLMFDKIVLRSTNGAPHIVNSGAEQRIRIDVKRFFNLDLDSRDVRSNIEHTRTTTLGMLGELIFYLKILFFKIDLKLATGVSFFEDSVHVPMVLNMPVNAPDYVHSKSGLIFSWNTDPTQVSWDMQTLMPPLDVALLTGDPAKLVEHGRRYCRGERCAFRMTGKIADQQFAQDFIIPKPLVDLGFFPMAVASVNQAQKDLGWEKKNKVEDTRIGLYFETSRLPKGDHSWEMWLRISPQSTTPVPECPAPIRVMGLTN